MPARPSSTRSGRLHRVEVTDLGAALPSRRQTSQGGSLDVAGFEVRRIQPYQALKRYLCPGCNQHIEAGLGHLVAIPDDQPELRRHWHHSCWANRHRRRPGRG